jgi:NTP pyrophosphatase (non-canonical NTP hydrolase)
MTESQILQAAIIIFGERNQEEMAVEECAELITAIKHKHRGRTHNIPEEIADVEIMLEQLKIINNCADEVSAIRKEKIERLCDNVFNQCL